MAIHPISLLERKFLMPSSRCLAADPDPFFQVAQATSFLVKRLLPHPVASVATRRLAFSVANPYETLLATVV